MNASMGRPVADLDDFLEAEPRPKLRTAEEPAPVATRRRSPVAWWVMSAAALAVAGGLAFWLWAAPGRSPDAIAAQTAADTARQAPTQAGVSGFAELYVAAFVGGDADAIAAFLPEPPALGMTPAAHYATRTAALDISPVDAGYWAVLVAADVLTWHEDGYVPAGMQYFQVGVVDDGGRMVAVALPARVGAPPPRVAAPRTLQIADQPPTETQAALVGDFLEAFLTGTRDIGRYTAHDSGIAAISPAPYSAVKVTAVAAYGNGSVIATVDAQEPAGPVTTLQYVVKISEDGLVAALLAGPPSIAAGSGVDQ